MDFLKLKTILATNYYSVPDYQRDYEWTNIQNSTLCEDVFSLFNSNDNHFIGAIVTIPFESNNSVNMSIGLNDYSIDKNNVRHVVDGQQRLTSLSIFVKATIDSIQNEQSISLSEKTKLRDKLIKLLNGDDYNNEDLVAPRLLLNGNTGRVYNKYILEIQSSDASNKSYKGAKRLLSAYDLFKKEINNQKNYLINSNIVGDALTFYKNLTKIITDRIEFVEIECPESSNAFQVFDSLNGKGLDLTAADRIKNIFMSWSPAGKGAQKWESIDNEIGSEYLTSFFVSMFFLLEKRRIAKNKLPDEFRNHFREEAQINYDRFFNDLKSNAIIYGELKKAKTCKKQINELLEDLGQLGNDQVYVMLFSAVSHYGKDIISSNKFKDYVKTLTNLVVRMQICEKTTNKLDTMFSRYIKLMADNDVDLTNLISEISSDMKNMTPDDDFERCFANYAPSDNNISEYYLRYLENYMRVENSGNRTGVKRKEATVEHIIPQTLDDLKDWYGDCPIPDEIKEDFNSCYVERIGNKALLFSDDNTSASNDPYLVKMNVYKNGMNNQAQGTPYDTFEMIKDVVDTYGIKFNHEEIEERSKSLAKIAVKIWN